MRCEAELGNDLPSGGESKRAGNWNELVNAIEDAQSREWRRNGGRIILTGNISIGNDEPFAGLRTESRDRPIVIMAERIGGATITGSRQLRFRNVKNLWLYGINFKYDPEDEGDCLRFENAEYCRISRCDFSTIHGDDAYDEEAPKHYYLRIMTGDRNLVDHNIFHDKPKSIGTFLVIGGFDSGDTCTNTIIERNYFLNHPGRGNQNGGEALRIGESSIRQKRFYSKVRYNLFEKCNGDVECVTNKSRENTYEHNTFRQNKGALSIRHGWKVTIDSNVFEECQRGIRIFGEDNKVLKNYLKNVPPRGSENDRRLVSIIIENGSNEGNPSHRQVRDSEISDNIIEKVDERSNRVVMWGSGNGDDSPRNNTFSKNKILALEGTIFDFREASSGDNNNTFRDNELFHKERVDVNLPESAMNRQRVDSLELPNISRPRGLTSEEVGPCSQILEFSFEDVIQRFNEENE